jgi:hypothetical protein
MTHMICELCEARDVIASECMSQRQTAVANYYGDLRCLVRDGRIDDALKRLEEAPNLGILPADLIVGLLQPFVAWIASFWVTAKLNSDYERRIVQPLSLLLNRLAEHYPELERFRNVEYPMVLFLSSQEFSAEIGLQIVELGLAARAVSSKIIVEAAVPEELCLQLLKYQPRVIGFTAMTEEQIKRVEGRVKSLRKMPEFANLTILLGGIATRYGFETDPELRIVQCRSIMDILRHIGSEHDGHVSFSGVFVQKEPNSQRAHLKSTVS